MNERVYSVSLHAPLGKRLGKLRVRRDGTALSGTLTILNHTQPFSGEVLPDGTCHIAGRFITLLRTVDFIAAGQIDRTAVRLELTAGHGHLVMSGEAEEGSQ